MTTLGERVAQAACELAGTRFRLHGRDPATGLDCVGLAAVALERAGLRADPPRLYALRNRSIGHPLEALARCDLIPADPPPLAGDILLVAPGPAQHHLLVTAGSDRFVHAHAGLRRIVVAPGPLPWPVLRLWRPLRKG